MMRNLYTLFIAAFGAYLVVSCTSENLEELFPCDDNIQNVSYPDDIVSIMDAHCNTSGCHNSTDQIGGIILDTYNGVKAQVDRDKLLCAIEHTDGCRPMPEGSKKLSDCNIDLVKVWIQEGALPDGADTSNACDTSGVISYSMFISPVITASCANQSGCHNNDFPAVGLVLLTHADFVDAVDNKNLLCRVNADVGCTIMPPSGNKLDSCFLAKLQVWVDRGSNDN